MTEVIPTWRHHAEADAVAGLGFCGALWGRLQSAMPWMTEVIPTGVIRHPHRGHSSPTGVIHAEADAVAGLRVCGADFSLP